MTQSQINTQRHIVFFLGYRHFTESGNYYCVNCAESVYNTTINEQNETQYLCHWEKDFSLWTTADYRALINYCGVCRDPLYDLKATDERWRINQLSSPSSVKQQRRFRKRRLQYGPRDGGTSQSTKRAKLF